MIPNGSVEESVLQVRVNELERRLALLERRIAQAIPDPAQAISDPAETRADAAGREPDLCAGDGTDPRSDASEPDAPNEAREGVRLVAIQMLSSGYARDETADYLRSTFGIADADAVIAGAGLDG